MQVYRGMDVGTAKPSLAERARVPHHLVDVADPWEEFSVVRFQAEAHAALHAVEASGRRALLVGGTGLYVQAVVDDLRFPGEDRALRAAIAERVAQPGGLEAAYAELTERDPVAAGRIEPGNERRIVRALEVIELTGEPFSSFGPGLDTYGAPSFSVRLVGITRPSDELHARIDRRLAAMVANGLVDEVRTLAADPRGWSRTARQAIGYKEILEHVEGDAVDLETALAAVVTRTRSFTKRQLAWFRRDPRICWIENSPGARDAVLASWSTS